VCDRFDLRVCVAFAAVVVAKSVGGERVPKKIRIRVGVKECNLSCTGSYMLILVALTPPCKQNLDQKIIHWRRNACSHYTSRPNSTEAQQRHIIQSACKQPSAQGVKDTLPMVREPFPPMTKREV
jgi:hypothetical protein